MSTNNDFFPRSQPVPVSPAEALVLEQRRIAASKNAADPNACLDSIFGPRHEAAHVVMRDVLTGDQVAPIHQLIKQELDK